MTKKKREEQPKKFEVKKRAHKEKPNFFENVTPFPHPVNEIFTHAKEIARQDTSKKVYQSQTGARPEPDRSQTDSVPRPEPDRSQVTEKSKSIAPEKDYNKRANILEREALPNGLFPGASKAIYDALYLRTLGAMTPKRTVQATRKELMKWSGIKNIKTINAHLKKLRELRLVEATNFIGEHTGAHYEVFLPDGMPDPTQTRPRPEVAQKMVSDQDQKMVWVGSGNPVENKATYENSKTSLKTNTNDDDALAGFAAVMSEISRKFTNKDLDKNEKEKWMDLAELLRMEFTMAAARTKSISSVPAFLCEHLRRRFLYKPVSEAGTAKVGKFTNMGKPESTLEEYKAEPLTEQGREAVLKTMREYMEKGQREFVLSQQESFTADDWDWLMKQASKK